MRIVGTGRQGRNPLWVSVEDEKSPDAGGAPPLPPPGRRDGLVAPDTLTTWLLSHVGDAAAARSCVSLMPYTLVSPHHPPVCRPVLLLPTVLGRVLDKKLAGWQGFQLCAPGNKQTGSLCV